MKAGVSGGTMILLTALFPNFAAGATVTLNPSVRHQTMLGYGNAGGVNVQGQFIKNHPYVPQKLIDQILDDAVFNLGINWAAIWPESHDNWENFNDNGDPNTVNSAAFASADVDERVQNMVLPLKQRVLARGEPFYVYTRSTYGSNGVPWMVHSPGEYAEHAVTLIQYLKNTYNIDVNYWSIENEPDLGKQAFASPQIFAKTIKTLGPELSARGLPTKVLMPEGTSASASWNWVQPLQGDAGVWPHVGLITWHHYGTSDPQRSQLQAFASSKGIPTGQTENLGQSIGTLFDDILLGGISFWTVAFGFVNFDDAIPLGTTYGVNSTLTSFTRSGHFWGLRQVMHYVRPGAVRIGATSDDPALKVVAFEKNGKTTIVLLTLGTSVAQATVSGLPAGTYGVSQQNGSGATVELGLRTLSAGGSTTVNMGSWRVLTIYPHPGGNLSPTVTDWAATPKFLVLPNSSVTLSAAAQDSELNPLTYQWSVVSQPAGASASLANPNAASTNANGLSVAGMYVFAVTVQDGANSVTREVLLNIHAGNPPPVFTELFVADAGGRQILPLNNNRFNLLGSASDPVGEPLTYQWTVLSQPAGSAVAFTNPTGGVTGVTNITQPGNYSFRIQVSDGTNIISDTLTNTVYPANPSAPVIPTIGASPAALTLPTNQTSLSATTSDPDGDTLTHWWSMSSVPAGVSPVFANPAARNTTVSGLTQPGTYVFNLAAIDETSVTNRTVTVSVGGAPSSDTSPPSVSITAPSSGTTISGTSVAVSGTAADNVGVAGVQFKVDGNDIGAEDALAPYSATFDSTLLSNGSHALTAVARDGAGNASTSTAVNVLANNALPPLPPPMPGVLLHATLDSAASVSSPAAGSGSGSSVNTSPTNDFVAGQTSNGIRIDAAGEYVRFQQLSGSIKNIETSTGTIQFWYKPNAAHTDAAEHYFFKSDQIQARKDAQGFLWLEFYDNGTNPHGVMVDPRSYSWAAGQWVRLRFTWNVTVPSRRAHIYINGQAPEYVHTDWGNFSHQGESSGKYIYIGNKDTTGTSPAGGVIDEFTVWDVDIPETPYTPPPPAVATLPPSAHCVAGSANCQAGVVGQDTAGFYTDPETGNKVYRLTDRTLCPVGGGHAYSYYRYFSLQGHVVVSCSGPSLPGGNVTYLYDNNYKLLGDVKQLSNATGNYRGLWWSTQRLVLYGTDGKRVWELDPFNHQTKVYADFSSITTINGQPVGMVGFDNGINGGIGPNDEVLVSLLKSDFSFLGAATYDPLTQAIATTGLTPGVFTDDANISLCKKVIWFEDGLGLRIRNLDFTDIANNPIGTPHHGLGKLADGTCIIPGVGSPGGNICSAGPFNYWRGGQFSVWNENLNQPLQGVQGYNCQFPGRVWMDHYAQVDVPGVLIMSSDDPTTGAIRQDRHFEFAIVKATITVNASGVASMGWRKLARHRSQNCGYSHLARVTAESFTGNRAMFDSNMAHPDYPTNEKTPGSCGVIDTYVVEDNGNPTPPPPPADTMPPAKPKGLRIK